MDERRDRDVVVAVDGSVTALGAVRWAAAEAVIRGSGLRIVHAAPYAVDAPARRRAAGILARAYTVAHRAEAAVAARTEQLDGAPAAALEAASENADLLVIGLIGRRPEDIALGSVAHSVPGVARCPVAVVREGRVRGAAQAPVVLGVTGPGVDDGATALAFADAERNGSPVVVLHAHRGPDPRDASAAVTEALQPWRRRHPAVPVEVRVESGGPVEALLRGAHVARLVVLGCGRSGTAVRAVLGSTSRAVVRHSPCPVVVVGPHASGSPHPVDQDAGPGPERARST